MGSLLKNLIGKDVEGFPNRSVLNSKHLRGILNLNQLNSIRVFGGLVK